MDKNKSITNNASNINDNKIIDRITNLLNSTKEKKSFKTGFFILKASLTFT